MKEKHTPERRRKILKGVYSSTWETSVIALAMVAVLEIAMLVYSTINLHSNNHEFAELIDLKGPQLVTLLGPGSLVAPVSGPSNVTIRVVNCEFNNKTRVSYPQNAIGYVLEGADTDLLFSNRR